MSSWANRNLPRKRDISTIVASSIVAPIHSKPVNEIIYPSIPVAPSPVVTHKRVTSTQTMPSYQKEIAYLDSYDATVEQIRTFSSLHSDAFITFIVPTVNRVTLLRTLTSIRQQTNQRWKAIILFDGCEPTEESLLSLLQDTRFLYISIKKHGVLSPNQRGKAGQIRNIGMSMVTTPWIGFVDDDDIIFPKYIENLMEESSSLSNVDLISFRMIDTDHLVPPPLCQSILPNQIGISFAIKSSLFKEGFLFSQSEMEDYHFVKEVHRAKKMIILSSHITYLTRDSIHKEYPKALRIVLR
jgi:cellulose synthase/poly-beta-1,6-N-acetylglucosamine synthase-like glycosyltransferase